MTPGTKLGPYEILAQIGAGGMGEVYRARDPRLGRDVAIKVSAERFSERFEREARAVAALNHPNVCTLHDVGPNYLVMELVEGESPKGPLPVETALDYARQIADALEAAHEKGIVHRDLKPENIKIKPDGTVKVLDFGLAKVAPASAGESQAEARATLTMGATEAGMILGTAAYMAPEQARGKPVDKRADIWAFGVVLYEMLAGRKPFKGDDVSEMLASVIKDDPEWDGIPAKAQRLLRSCLEKDPKQRLRDIADARLLLEEPAQQQAMGLRYVPAGVMALIAAVVTALWLIQPVPVTLAWRFAVEPPPDTIFSFRITGTEISPDGRFLVFRASGSGAPSLWLRPLDSLAARPLPGTEGADFPFWSPDSKSIAFFARGELMRADLVGGTPAVLCEADSGEVGLVSMGGTWNRDGVILFATRQGVLRVPASGGMPVPIVAADASRQEIGFSYPQFLPDGKHFLYGIASTDAGTSGVYAGSLDRPQDRVQVLKTEAKAIYAAPIAGRPGSLLFLRGRTLLAQNFDAGKIRLQGDPTPLAEDIAVLPSVRGAAFWASDSGVLVYRSGAVLETEKLMWMSREGKRMGVAGSEVGYNSLRISPDGKRAAIGHRDQTGQDDIWLLEFERGGMTRLTFDPKRDTWPVWSPDGRQIAFSSDRSGSYQLYRKDSGGAAQEEQLTRGGNPKSLTDWSHDGRYLLYQERDPKTGDDLWALPLEGGRKPMAVLQTPFNESDAQFSPDGKWIAYTSNESGGNEVYVQAFPPAGGKWQVSNQGGRAPRWRGDGKELFYLTNDNRKLMAAGIRTAPESVGTDTPHALFTTFVLDETRYPYDVTPDGQRFVIDEISGGQGSAPLTVVINWHAELKR